MYALRQERHRCSGRDQAVHHKRHKARNQRAGCGDGGAPGLSALGLMDKHPGT
jgi:hypothetical protein